MSVMPIVMPGVNEKILPMIFEYEIDARSADTPSLVYLRICCENHLEQNDMVGEHESLTCQSTQ